VYLTFDWASALLAEYRSLVVTLAGRAHYAFDVVVD
jgi:hypothetical protein